MGDSVHMPPPRYEDLDLVIDEAVGDGYPCRIVRSPAGEARGVLRLQRGAAELEQQLEALQKALRDAPQERLRPNSPEQQQVQQLGQMLFEALFSGRLRDRLAVAREQMRSARKRLRIRLRIQAPDLAVLPWEFLYDPARGDYLCLRDVSLVRYLELEDPVPPLRVEPPLRILGVVSSPTDCDRLDTAEERRRLTDATVDLQTQGLVNLTWIDGSGWRDIQQAMGRGPWHIVHFIGHGGFDQSAHTGLLALTKDDGAKDLVSDQQLARLLTEQPSLRMVVLNSCEGARGSVRDLFTSTAAALIRGGVPAVLAMQYEISNDAAIEFSRSFYGALSEGLAVDHALARARTAISFAVPNSVEWGTPVLHLRAEDGVIFRLGRRGAEKGGGRDVKVIQTPKSAPPGNIPEDLSSFVGRQRELEDVKGLLDENHLVTLVGPGGSGKTRLAIRVAREARERFRDGAYLVELATTEDGGQVVQRIAAELGIREQPRRSFETQLGDWLRDRALLLVLDNCEQVAADCAQFTELVRRHAPGVRLLASSREPLRAMGEVLYEVPVLSLPAAGGSPAAIALSEAVQLLVARGAAAKFGFGLTEQNAAALAAICRRLDGIPLAIELAAAHIRLLAPEALLEKLNDRFGILKGGSRTALPRHQTMRATLAWSYDSLDEECRTLFRRLSVFGGGWTADAAEAVCATGVAEKGSLLGRLEQLVEKSLVQVDRQGTQRQRLLETMREYAAELLAEEEQDERATRDRHLAWVHALVQRAAQGLDGPNQGDRLNELETEHDNVRNALDRTVRTDDAAAGFEIVSGAHLFWAMRGHWTEGRGWLDRLVDLPSAAKAAAEVRGRAELTAATLAQYQGDYDTAEKWYATSFDLAGTCGDRRTVAKVLKGQGELAQARQDVVAAHEAFVEALRIARTLGDSPLAAAALVSLGNEALGRDDLDDARITFEEALRFSVNLGDHQVRLASSSGLGTVAFYQRDFEAARAAYAVGLETTRRLGDKRTTALMSLNLGDAATALEDSDRAATAYDESLTLLADLGDRENLAACLESIGALAVVVGRPSAAARLLAVATKLRETIGAPLPADRIEAVNRARDRVRSELGVDAFDQAQAESRALTWHEVTSVAFDVLRRRGAWTVAQAWSNRGEQSVGPATLRPLRVSP